jgi:hypothetical protein
LTNPDRCNILPVFSFLVATGSLAGKWEAIPDCPFADNMSEINSHGGVMKQALLVVCLLLLAGCGGFSGKQSTIIEAGDPDQVKDCQLLKTYRNPAGYQAWGTPYLGDFKNKALQEAEKMGATHILYRPESEGLELFAVIKAYKCPVNQETDGEKEENRNEY